MPISALQSQGDARPTRCSGSPVHASRPFVPLTTPHALPRPFIGIDALLAVIIPIVIRVLLVALDLLRGRPALGSTRLPLASRACTVCAIRAEHGRVLDIGPRRESAVRLHLGHLLRRQEPPTRSTRPAHSMVVSRLVQVRLAAFIVNAQLFLEFLTRHTSLQDSVELLRVDV